MFLKCIVSFGILLQVKLGYVRRKVAGLSCSTKYIEMCWMFIRPRVIFIAMHVFHFHLYRPWHTIMSFGKPDKKSDLQKSLVDSASYGNTHVIIK